MALKSTAPIFAAASRTNARGYKSKTKEFFLRVLALRYQSVTPRVDIIAGARLSNTANFRSWLCGRQSLVTHIALLPTQYRHWPRPQSQVSRRLRDSCPGRDYTTGLSAISKRPAVVGIERARVLVKRLGE